MPNILQQHTLSSAAARQKSHVTRERYEKNSVTMSDGSRVITLIGQ